MQKIMCFRYYRKWHVFLENNGVYLVTSTFFLQHQKYMIQSSVRNNKNHWYFTGNFLPSNYLCGLNGLFMAVEISFFSSLPKCKFFPISLEINMAIYLTEANNFPITFVVNKIKILDGHKKKTRINNNNN